MKIAIYSRVSTLDQHPENQTVALKEYVANHKDWELYEVYEDKTSGAKESRPALDKMMQDARKHMFQHVVFWKVDRLGRNAIHVQTLANEWRNLGIDFTITTLGIDTSTPIGKFLFGILSQFAEMERSLIIERTNLGLNRVKKNLKDGHKHIAKSGRSITQLGRPVGKKDSHPRAKGGYYKAWDKRKNE